MLDAGNAFRKRIFRLQHLYDFMMHSLAQLREDIRDDIEDGRVSPKDHLPSHYGSMRQYTLESVLHHSKTTYPGEFRSLLLIGLVSEFEVFLVSHAKRIASRAKLLGRKNAMLEWERQRLFAFDTVDAIREHLLDSDTRSLTSGGFEKIQEYYENVLAVSISDSGVSLLELQEIHARRHLHVHRRGLIDAHYLKAFNKKVEVNTYLPVGDEYLRDAFAKLRKVAKYLVFQCDAKYPPKASRVIAGGTGHQTENVVVHVRARFTSEAEMVAYFGLDRPLMNAKSNRLGLTLGDLLVGGRSDGLIARWIVTGKQDELAIFFVDLRNYTSRRTVTHVQHERVNARGHRLHEAINYQGDTPVQDADAQKKEPLDNQPK